MGSEGEGGTPKPTAVANARGRSRADRDYRPETVVRAPLSPACRSGSAPFETEVGFGTSRAQVRVVTIAPRVRVLIGGSRARSNFVRRLEWRDGAGPARDRASERGLARSF